MQRLTVDIGCPLRWVRLVEFNLFVSPAEDGSVAPLQQFDWVRQHRNLIIGGPFGVGNTIPACTGKAPVNPVSLCACCASRPLESLTLAHGHRQLRQGADPIGQNGHSHHRRLGLGGDNAPARNGPAEVIADRNGNGSTVITIHHPLTRRDR